MCKEIWLQVVIFSVLSGLVELCQLYLTISPNGDTAENSFLEINWGPNCKEVPESIGIFERNPSVSEQAPQFSLRTNNKPSGYYLTNIPLGKLDLSADIFNATNSGTCVNYYIAGYNKTSLMMLNCFKIRPKWMSLEKDVDIVPLKDLFIPGTHASGCYREGTTKSGSILINNFGYTQNFDVFTQLILGVRYLDLTVSFLESNTGNDLRNYFISNENILIRPLTNIISDVRRFIELSSELIIIDFSGFAIGFHKHPGRYSEVIDILENELGDKIFRRDHALDFKNCYDLTIRDIRGMDKNLIVLYPREILHLIKIDKAGVIWPTWNKFSPAHFNKSETLDFMRQLFTRKDASPIKNEGWIFYGTKELEESYNPHTKLQTTAERADEINHDMTNWLGGPWSLTANVVAIDFVMSTGLIDIAVYSNRHKAFEHAGGNWTKFEII